MESLTQLGPQLILAAIIATRSEQHESQQWEQRSNACWQLRSLLLWTMPFRGRQVTIYWCRTICVSVYACGCVCVYAALKRKPDNLLSERWRWLAFASCRYPCRIQSTNERRTSPADPLCSPDEPVPPPPWHYIFHGAGEPARFIHIRRCATAAMCPRAVICELEWSAHFPIRLPWMCELTPPAQPGTEKRLDCKE